MRRYRFNLFLGCLTLAALLWGCDEKKELTPAERLFRLGASAASVCPATDPEFPGEPGKADLEILGTVFGRDGSTASGVPVTFSTDFGCFDPQGACTPEVTVSTGKDGVARTTLGTTRPPGDLIMVRALTDNSLDDSLQIKVPRAPQILVQATPDTPKVNETFLVGVEGSVLCDVYRLDLDLSYDPAVVDFDDSVDRSLLDTTGDGTDVATELTLGDLPGRLTASYYRTNSPLSGVSISGTFLTFRFKALAAGKARFKVESFTYTAVEGRPYPSLSDQTFVTEVTVVTASAK